MREFAQRVERVEPSATLAVSNKAGALEAEGADVVDLSVGEPDFPTPTPVVEAGKAAMDAGHTGYAPSQGIRALREAISDDLARRNVDHGAEEILVTPGAKMALFEAIQALIDEGDEVVLLDPAWVSYEAMVNLAGGSIVRVDTARHDFQLGPTLHDLEAVVSDRTQLLIVNSPSNPTGAVYSDQALAGVRDLAVDHDFDVISDEIYGSITYGEEPLSLGSLDGMTDRTVTVDGFSKAYSMTGWRLGYVAGPEEVVSQATKIQSHSVTCAANFVQHAGVAALETASDAVDEMVQAFEARRDLLVDLLADEGLDVPVPDGAFYMFLPVDDDDDEAWCMDAIEEAHVATVPGRAFGSPGYARISYANSEDRIREAVERLADAGFL